MPKAGRLVVTVSPVEARLIAAWLPTLPPPLWGVPLSNTVTLANGIRLELVNTFAAVANRKRRACRHVPVGIELDREDVQWFAAKVSGGMMFRGSRAFLPPEVQKFCAGCLSALRKKRGRRRLYGATLRQASSRSHLDQRHRKRLRARERSEDSDLEFWRDLRGLGSATFRSDQG